MKRTKLCATLKRVGTWTRNPWRIHYRRRDNVTVHLGDTDLSPKRFAQLYAHLTGHYVEIDVTGTQVPPHRHRIHCAGPNDLNRRTITLGG